MKILLTGATGFLGQNLKPVLEQDYEVCGIGSKFWDLRDPATAQSFLKKWYFWATHSRLPPIIDKAKTLKNHWNGILNYINTKIDNGVLEGLNSLIQAAKDSARGFRSTRNFITTIYLRLGKLHFNLPT